MISISTKTQSEPHAAGMRGDQGEWLTIHDIY